MKTNFSSFFLLAVGTSLGNFCWQAMQQEPVWLVAFERSFFQVGALLVAWFVWRDPEAKK